MRSKVGLPASLRKPYARYRGPVLSLGPRSHSARAFVCVMTLPTPVSITTSSRFVMRTVRSIRASPRGLAAPARRSGRRVVPSGVRSQRPSGRRRCHASRQRRTREPHAWFSSLSCASEPLLSHHRTPHALVAVDGLFVRLAEGIVIDGPARTDDDALDEPVPALLAVIVMPVVPDRVEVAHPLLGQPIAHCRSF